MSEINRFIDNLQDAPVAGLAYLNSRVPHRFTAVFRLEGDTMRNVYWHDKNGEPRPEPFAAVPLDQAFCAHALRDGCFLTQNSGSDKRLDGHPYQGVLVAYHGVPVHDEEGAIYGSLCHFDMVEQPLPFSEFAFLQSAARALPPFLEARGDKAQAA